MALKCWISHSSYNVIHLVKRSKVHTCRCFCVHHILHVRRFEIPGDAWHLTPHPSGILDAIERHLEFLTKQLISEDVLKSVGKEEPSSPAGEVLKDTLSLATVLARVASVSENYSELKRCHDLISFTVEMVQNLLKLVREREGG